MIERAKKEDLQKILYLQYLAYQTEAKLFQNPNIPPLKQTLRELEDEYEKGIVLKALDENRTIIGSVRAHENKGTAYIGKLMVHPQMRRRGIGTKLLLEIEKRFPERRYELFTSAKSKNNIALYEKLGYQIFDEKQITDELRFIFLEKNERSKTP